MRSRISVVALILVLAAAILPFGYGHSAAYQSTITDVRIFHALSDIGEADLYINDVFAGTAVYGGTAGYVVVQPGTTRIRAFAPGSDPTSATPLFDSTFEATEKLDWNVALVGTSTAPELKAFPVACDPIGFGLGRLNFVQTIPAAAPAVVAVVAADGTSVSVENVVFGEPQAIEVPAGIYTLNIEGVVSGVSVNVGAGATGTAYIIGETADTPANILTFFGAAEALDSAGFLRVVHAIPSGEPVDVYLNDTLFAAALSPEHATIYAALGPANYDLKIFAAGSDVAATTPLLNQAIEIVDGVSTVGLVQSGSYGPSLALFSEDRTAPAENEAKVNVLNIGLPSVDLAADGVAVITALAAGQGTFTLGEGVHELSASSNGTAFETLSKFTIADDNAASVYTLVVTSEKIIVLRGRPDQ